MTAAPYVLAAAVCESFVKLSAHLRLVLCWLLSSAVSRESQNVHVHGNQ